MNIKFCTNSISTKTKLPTLSDIVKAAQTKVAMTTTEPVTKTASAVAAAPAKAVVTATKKACCPKCKQASPCKCPKGAKPCAADAKAPAKAAATKTAEEKAGVNDEGKDSGQPKAEAKLVNDPHKDPKLKSEKASASSGSEKSDEAESSGQLDVEPLHQKGESTQEKPGDLETQKDKKEKSAQSVLHAFVKIANLTGKQKEFLRKTWSLYYPASFIDALLADR